MKKFFADLWSNKAFRSAMYAVGGAFGAFVSQWFSATDFGGTLGGAAGAFFAFVAAQLTRWLETSK